ncbi:uncharacterized protein FA14DRAFT_132581 [Meira miltonrushii]|uniref:IMS import disulfide relay-system CHCH-CHCH-like Cx9C domain-containing protein n=1 Tax=Meira miltonrushii TaxID=1280837 RepID=A0A316VBX5_9BASI|nr:uncharacterized protein FA14DRAFT_132581 [Meira miltonrushii]PWN34804.1 hypothetical protein FA14DRAFT_132581 [Meira miltonrushii]
MEQSIELVAKNCGNELNSFQRCILSHRGDQDGGESACEAERQTLSKCAANAVPLVATVKSRCQSQIRAYDACLLAGRSDDDEQITQRCTPALKALWQCTEAVKREELIKSGGAPQGGESLQRPV